MKQGQHNLESAKYEYIIIIIKYVSNVPGKYEVNEQQKTAILGTAHILRKVLM